MTSCICSARSYAPCGTWSWSNLHSVEFALGRANRLDQLPHGERPCGALLLAQPRGDTTASAPPAFEMQLRRYAPLVCLSALCGACGGDLPGTGRVLLPQMRSGGLQLAKRGSHWPRMATAAGGRIQTWRALATAEGHAQGDPRGPPAALNRQWCSWGKTRRRCKGAFGLAAARLWSAEQRRDCGPRAQRGSITDSPRLFERSERSERSEFGGGAARPSSAGESERSADRSSEALRPARTRLCCAKRGAQGRVT